MPCWSPHLSIYGLMETAVTGRGSRLAVRVQSSEEGLRSSFEETTEHAVGLQKYAVIGSWESGGNVPDWMTKMKKVRTKDRKKPQVDQPNNPAAGLPL
eukprot:scaffold56458_cov20-Tisochrysis_lutea.AAC.1